MLAYAGLLALIASLILVLSLALPVWISAFVVTGGVLTFAGLFLFLGYQEVKAEKLAPRQTLETLKEDVEWAKEQRT